MSPVVLALVSIVTVIWVGIVAGIWAVVSVSDEYPPETAGLSTEE